jgi:HK97 family phage prohead protease
VRSGGDGRTVEAYAAVFDNPVEIHDQDGHYHEQISRTAFNRTLSHRGTSFGVFYNHGKTLYGTPSERASMPLGTPLEVRADSKGLLTVTRYNKTPLADEVLAAIENGDLRGQSFTGRMRSSSPARGPYRARAGELTTVTRNEIELVEYGPTPFPAYEAAAIVGTRSLMLSDSDSALLQLILGGLADADAALDPIVDALTKTDQALDASLAVLSEILGTINPDQDADEFGDTGSDPERATYLTRLSSLATRLTQHRSGTPNPGLASADALDDDTVEHSAPTRSSATQVKNRAHLYRMGVL